MKQHIRLLKRQLAIRFAPYLVTDSYGTYRHCWTLARAMYLLQYCAPHHAQIMHTYSYKIVACRIQYK